MADQQAIDRWREQRVEQLIVEIGEKVLRVLHEADEKAPVEAWREGIGKALRFSIRPIATRLAKTEQLVIEVWNTGAWSHMPPDWRARSEPLCDALDRMRDQADDKSWPAVQKRFGELCSEVAEMRRVLEEKGIL